MPRTDPEGRTLETVLDAVLGRRVERAEIFGALGISRSNYFRRRDEDDFPTAEETRVIATHFELSPAVVMLRFGLLDEDDVLKAAEQITQIRAANQLAGRVADGGAGLDLTPLVKANRRGVVTRLKPKLQYSVQYDKPGFDRP